MIMPASSNYSSSFLKLLLLTIALGTTLNAFADIDICRMAMDGLMTIKEVPIGRL